MYLILVVRIVPGDTDALEARCVRTVFFVVRHGVAAVDNDGFKCVWHLAGKLPGQKIDRQARYEILRDCGSSSGPEVADRL